LTYYASTLLKDVELWVKKSPDHWVPVHDLASRLGPEDCKLQPFIYAFSGKDNTNFIYGIGKTKMLKCRHQLDCETIASYGETSDFSITDDLTAAARNLLMAGSEWWTGIFYTRSISRSLVHCWRELERS